MDIMGGFTQPLAGLAEEARELEAKGVDIAGTAELTHDPLIQLALAATTTATIVDVNNVIGIEVCVKTSIDADISASTDDG